MSDEHNKKLKEIKEKFRMASSIKNRIIEREVARKTVLSECDENVIRRLVEAHHDNSYLRYFSLDDIEWMINQLEQLKAKG